MYNDQFSKLFQPYLGQDAVHKFTISMVKESKCCSRVMKKHFNKEHVMTKEHDEILKALQNIGFVIILLLKVML